MDQIRALWTNFTSWFLGRTERERRLLVACAGAVAVFVLFILVFSFASSASSYRRRTAYKQTQLQEVEALASSYNEAQRSRQSIEQQLTSNDVKLISYLEEKGSAVGLDIPTINPKGDVPIGDGRIVESSVELTLTDVPLGKLVNFLQNVERGPGVVKVKSLRLEPRSNDQVLTAWTTIATYRLKGS
jgi:general secretion pathway protein M